MIALVLGGVGDIGAAVVRRLAAGNVVTTGVRMLAQGFPLETHAAQQV
jgi:predicted dinucleotide-binding enzyme